MTAAVKPFDPIGKTMPVQPGQLFVSGKINAIDKFQTKTRETRYRTRVLMKDKSDDFSYPMPVDVQSQEPLGKTGELWEGIVIIRTFRRDYVTRPDSETGEVRKIKQVELNCFLID